MQSYEKIYECNIIIHIFSPYIAAAQQGMVIPLLHKTFYLYIMN